MRSSAAGSTFSEYYGVNGNIGRAIMIIASLATVLLGLNKLVQIIGYISPVLLLVTIVIGVISIASNPEGIAQADASLQTITVHTNFSNWVISGLMYGAYTVTGVVPYLADIGKSTSTNKKNSVWGGVFGGGAFILAVMMVTFIDKMQENVADTEAEIVEWYREEAESAGVTLTQDEVMDEIAADFAGNMMENPDLFREFSQSNRTVAQKLLDSLKEFIAKVKSIFTGKARDVAAQEAYGKDFAEQQAERAKTAAGEGDGRMMLKDYSYDALVRKPDMTLAVVEDADGLIRKEVVDKALAEAKKYGGVNQDGNVYVHVNDTDADVIISAKALRHGLDRRFTVNAPVTLKVGEILQNAVRVNELVPKLDTMDAPYVLMGAAKNKNNEPYIVQFVVNRVSNEVMSVDVLYAINAKTEPAALLPEITGVPATLTGSSISISDLLTYVNRYFLDVLPESVLRHFSHSERPAGKLGEGATAVSGAELCERLFQSTPPARGATRPQGCGTR